MALRFQVFWFGLVCFASFIIVDNKETSRMVAHSKKDAPRGFFWVKELVNCLKRLVSTFSFVFAIEGTSFASVMRMWRNW